MVVRLDRPDGDGCALGLGEHHLGTAADCTVRLEPGAAEHHASLLVRPYSALLADLPESTGTWLNGVRLEVPTQLADGDLLRLGESEWRVRVEPRDEATGPVVLPARIEVVEGERVLTGQVIDDGQVLWVGRAPDLDLTLADRFCSRRHAMLRREGDRLYVRDAGSVNGITIGEQRVLEARLESGETVTIGRTTLRFRVIAPPPPESDLKPTGRFGPYRVFDEIGRGGMGRVYRAQRDGDGLIALKIMRTDRISAETAAVRRRRFEREAAVLRRVRHEHVVGFIDAGEHQDIPYLALELLDGESLIELLRRREQLPNAEIERIVFQLCAAVKAVHEAGVIHRDIKPANVILHGERRVAKLMDFGIARFRDAVDLSGDVEELTERALEAEVTAEGKHPGTPLFMSPEQVRGRGVDMRSDIWSLGVVLYLLVSGRPPFSQTGSEALKRAVVEACPAPLPDDVPAYLRSAIYRCMLKPPSHRFDSAMSLMEALHERRIEQPVPVGAHGPEIRSLSHCPSCGSYVSPRQNECPICRLDLRVFRTRQMVCVELDGQFITACGGCGMRAAMSDETCPRCGRLLAVLRSAAELLESSDISDDDAAALTEALRTTKTCPACGAPADAGRPQCPACGIHLPAIFLGRVILIETDDARQLPHCGNCRTRLRGGRPVCPKCGLNFVTGRLRNGTAWHRPAPRGERR